MAVTTENFSAAISGWTTVRGSVALARVASDNSGSIASTTNGHARRDFDTGSADMFTEVDVVAAGADANRTVFLSARHTATNSGGSNSLGMTCYAAALNANAGTLSVLRYTGASGSTTPTATALVSGLSVSIPATPFRFRIEVEGSTIRVFIGDTQVWSGNDTAITANTRGGLGFFNAGTTPAARIDNFRTGALADDRTTVVDAAATLTGGGSLSTGATATRPAAATLSGGGSLSTSATQQQPAAASLSGGGQLGTAAAVARPAAAALSAGGELTTAATPARTAAVTLAAGGALSATAGQVASATLSGGGQLTTAAQQGHRTAAALSAGGALTTAAQQGHRTTVALSAGGALSTTGTRTQPAAATLSGGGELSTTGTRVKVAAATLAGGGELGTGPVLRTAVAAVTLSGGGRLTARATSTAGGSLNPSLWARDPGSGRWVALPHAIDLSVTDVENGVGSVSFQYPAFGWRSDLLRTYVTDRRRLQVEVWLEGHRGSRMVGRVDQRQGDDVDERALWSFSGTLITDRLDEGVIEPQPLVGETTLGPDVEVTKASVTTAQWNRLYALGYRTSTTDTTTVRVPQKVINAVKANAVAIPVLADPKREARFTSATPGAIMLFLLGQCWARGALTDLTVDFTATRDSAGTPWPEVLTAKWSPQVTLLQVAERLAELFLAEFTVSPDRVVQMWVPGGRGVDRTTGTRPVTLRRGQNLLEAGRRQGSRGAGTDFFIAGGEGQFTKVTDANARAGFGEVIERGLSVGNIDDPTALAAAGQRAREAGVRGEDERTFSLALGVGQPRPGRGLGVGDRARVDTSGVLGSERLAQWHVTYGPSGVGAEITTGDLIRSRAAGLLKRLTEQQSGDTIIGTSTPREDRGVPVAPAGVVVGSGATVEGAEVISSVTVGWQAVTINTDATMATDLDSYRVEWALATNPNAWQLAADVDASRTSASFTAAPATPIRVRVRARDRSGNVSVWSTVVDHVTDDDATPPPVSSAPTAVNYLGTLRIGWDGRTSDGALMTDAASDFAWCEIHIAPGSNFTPAVDAQTGQPVPRSAGGTLVGRIYGPGEFVVADLPYGVAQFVRLVPVDTRENRQPTPSAQASATPGKLVNIDLGPDAVARANIQLAAIGTAQVDLLAVNSARISDVEMGKVSAGQIRAAMILVSGGMISTRANGTGSGWDGDSAGIRLYDPSGQLRVDFKTVNGSALVTGEYRTALSGTRMVLNPLGSAPATMQFYPSSSSQFAVMGPLTSQAAGFEGQAGIGLKGFSPRSDQQSGEVTVFPSYAALAWGNERGDGAITTRIAATIGNAFIGGPKLDFSYSPGQQAYIGAAENNAYYTRNRIRIAPRDGAANGNVSIGSDGPQKAYLQFDTQILSVVNDTTFINIQANQCVSVSDRRRKHHIHGLGETHDAAGIVRRAGVYRYRMRDLEPRRAAGGIGGEQIGLMHDELPPEVLVYNADQDTWGVDIYGALAILWHAVKGEMGRQDRTADAVAALERRLGPALAAVS